MKSRKFLFFTLVLGILSFNDLFAQVKTYEVQWKKIDELIQKKNLPQSALAEVKKIYSLAKKENQEAQVIKALVYMSSLQEQTREDNLALSIAEFEKEIASANEPVLSILKNIQAAMYWDYLQNNRWRLYERTNTVNFSKSDINTWTLDDLHARISELFLASIDNKDVLQRTSLAPYDAIILKGNVRHLRPTLYDLLANHALDYFENTERDVNRPAYAFEINQPEAFAPANEFISYSFTTRDTSSLLHKALQIYQEILAFHLNDPKKDALIDADINRIRFAYNHSVAENKDSLYLYALDNIINKYANNAIAKQAFYLKAAWYEEEAGKYNPFGDTTKRFHRITARNILIDAIRDSSVKSEGWVNSYNLLQQINQPSFSFQIEKVNLPKQPFRALVNYRNINGLYFRLIAADESLKEELEDDKEDNFWNILTNAPAYKSWQQNLPGTNDLQEHAVEIKIDGLPLGEYYLLASPDAQFDRSDLPLGARLFFVSNISFINQGENFFVLHRESGKPLANATAEVFQQVYNYNTYKYTRKRLGTYRTNNNGYFQADLKNDNRYWNYYIDIQYNNDRLNLDETIYQYYYSDNTIDPSKVVPKIFFFTDRSIYRPGQTVHFKGIAIKSHERENEIATGFNTTVYLRNANYELTDSIQVTTNEFGSFSGSFQLPEGVLNGSFYILDKTNRSSVNFSVEEYKRPKFYVEFEKIKESYKVDDTITITGNAKAYAGNNIDGAKVSYRVVRKPRFIYRWYFFKSWLPPVEEMEIAHGEATTDANGKFIIQFQAIPDRKLEIKHDPVFDYHVYADVTDINGETRSENTIVTAGYKSLILQVTVPERVAVDSLKEISVRTENMNGAFQPSLVTVTMHKLIPEKRLIRARYWKQPDQFVMGMQEYISFFPHDEYRDETDPETWNKGEKVFEKTDSSKENSQFSIINNQFSIGYYQVQVITKDRDGNEIKDVRIIELFDPSSNEFSKPEYLWTKGTGGPIEPGESTTVQVGTSASNVFLIHETDKQIKKVTEIPIQRKNRQPIPTLEKNEETGDYFFTDLDKERKTFTYSATEDDRGGYGVNFFFVKDNRFYQFGDIVFVPWSNKDLQIEYATFRDKTLPGSEETWKVKITGYKNEKVAAEMLASMYDASLDQFRPHNWRAPDLWPRYLNRNRWEGRVNFTGVESMTKWVENDVYRTFEKQYDRLLGANRGRRDQVYLESVIVTGVDSQMQRGEETKFAAPVFKKEMEVMAGVDVTENNSIPDVQEVSINDADIQIRKNFNETAFFFPDLRTDENGSIEFSFTAPEALTRWKLQTLAHTKELAFGFSQKEMVTQKKLMVQPNMPRFLRQGDRMELSVKIVNLSEKELTGQTQLLLFDAGTNQSVDGWFINSFPNQYFTVAAGQSEVVNFPVQVPFEFSNALTWRVVAVADNFSDGEENILPVLTNKILVTETLPMRVRGSETKEFTFEKLLQSGSSETLQHHSLTLEYTSNPAWYAVQALPYLMEYPYDCAEQVWNRYYANALATKIANASPRIREIFEKWKTIDTAALISNLEKNPELKSALLEETPWVLEAKSETEQKKNIALLFDMVRMSRELKSSLAQLEQMQSSNGGFVWFKGGPDDRYITQYIITGIGHLSKLGIDISELNEIVNSAIPYLDKKIKEDYDLLVKNKADLKKQQISHLQIQYLYMRSFFPKNRIATASQKAFNFYKDQANKFWMDQNKYMQGMIALALHRFEQGNQDVNAIGSIKENATSHAILKSLKETSIVNEEMGMFWKNVRFGYSWFWWYAPIETQALMIEAFTEISNDTKTVDDLRTWLIKNKQTNNWGTTKATADACYAMLLEGTDWLTGEPIVVVQLGSRTISNQTQKTEAGTGYFKERIEGRLVNPEMGNISVQVQQPINQLTNKPVNAPSWGAVYWQYFEDMDKITTATTPLQLVKKLFIEKNTDRGPVLTPVEEGTELKVGDKIKVRIELRVDRDMEYVHMKDMRASALEPVNVLSGYRWQDGLGYYETTKDASTNFFFNYLRKGTYVFEYGLFVSHTGNFSNGITTIQCMYAPEFSAHSKGVRISVE